jgi:hypothetical protein
LATGVAALRRQQSSTPTIASASQAVSGRRIAYLCGAPITGRAASGVDRNATLSAVSTRAADDCMPRMMREPTRVSLTSDAVLLLTHGIGPLLSPKGDRPGSIKLTIGFA